MKPILSLIRAKLMVKSTTKNTNEYQSKVDAAKVAREYAEDTGKDGVEEETKLYLYYLKIDGTFTLEYLKSVGFSPKLLNYFENV